MCVRCYEIVEIHGDYSHHPTDKRIAAYSRWGYAPLRVVPRRGTYQKLPPWRAELAGAGENVSKSLIGAPCPEAFSM